MRYVFFCSLQFMYICARHQYKCNRQKRELNLRAKRALFFKCKIAIGILFDFYLLLFLLFFCSAFFSILQVQKSRVCVWVKNHQLSQFGILILVHFCCHLGDFYFLLFAFLVCDAIFNVQPQQQQLRVSFLLLCFVENLQGIYVCTRSVLDFYIFKCSN